MFYSTFSFAQRHGRRVLCLNNDIHSYSKSPLPAHTREIARLVMGCIDFNMIKISTGDRICVRVILFILLPERKGLSVNRIVSRWMSTKRFSLQTFLYSFTFYTNITSR